MTTYLMFNRQPMVNIRDSDSERSWGDKKVMNIDYHKYGTISSIGVDWYETGENTMTMYSVAENIFLNSQGNLVAKFI